MRELLCVSLLWLAACSASGPEYSGLSSVSSPKVGRIVMYREDSIYDITQTFWVEADGKQICSLHNASYFVKEVTPGNHYITSSRFMAIGTSKMPLTVKAGETVYAKMEVSGSRAMGGIFGGVLANTVQETITENAGPVYLGTVSKDKAQAEMQGLNEDCH